MEPWSFLDPSEAAVVGLRNFAKWCRKFPGASPVKATKPHSRCSEGQAVLELPGGRPQPEPFALSSNEEASLRYDLVPGSEPGNDLDTIA